MLLMRLDELVHALKFEVDVRELSDHAALPIDQRTLAVEGERFEIRQQHANVSGLVVFSFARPVETIAAFFQVVEPHRPPLLDRISAISAVMNTAPRQRHSNCSMCQAPSSWMSLVSYRPISSWRTKWIQSKIDQSNCLLDVIAIAHSRSAEGA
jgi:hypothetical protein